mmetsp:Transcript_15244/g.46487  ORF Transcript_15244/g.46487 Transcript_15244/m.46487 type:complete len:108 (+) Transcript_15244:232-555(+)|eukprot:scaffold184289_cov27-Tisochrysis_lutea.AAC.1
MLLVLVRPCRPSAGADTPGAIILRLVRSQELRQNILPGPKQASPMRRESVVGESSCDTRSGKIAPVRKAPIRQVAKKQLGEQKAKIAPPCSGWRMACRKVASKGQSL